MPESNLFEVLFKVCWDSEQSKNSEIMAPWSFLLRGATLVFSLVVTVASLGSGDANNPNDSLLFNLTQINGDAGLRTRAAKDFYLRIMPLGASITSGVGSSDGNGYRKNIRDELRYGRTASGISKHFLC